MSQACDEVLSFFVPVEEMNTFENFNNISKSKVTLALLSPPWLMATLTGYD